METHLLTQEQARNRAALTAWDQGVALDLLSPVRVLLRIVSGEPLWRLSPPLLGFDLKSRLR